MGMFSSLRGSKEPIDHVPNPLGHELLGKEK